MNDRNLRHDLRTPIHHIIGYGEMLCEELAGSPDDERLLSVIHASISEARRLLQIINAAPPEAEDDPDGFGDWRTPLDRLDQHVDRIYTGVGEASPEWLEDLERIRNAAVVLRALFLGQLDAATKQFMVPVSRTTTHLAELVGEPRGRILLVDDDQTSLQMMERRLAREGYGVSFAGSGQEALARIAEAEFDVVLLDLLMPEMNGLDVLREIRKTLSLHVLPVIAVTARHSSGIIVEALGAGANDYITKPVDFPVALARINTQIYLRRVTRDLREANERLRQLSFLDPLTGISNRRSLDAYLREQWESTRDTGLPFAVIMVDVDHFKLYNDHYGHDAGDEVLINIACSLKNVIDGTEGLVARYGGEEFVAALPGAPADFAMEIASRIREAVLALEIAHVMHPTEGRVTVSVGVAVENSVDPLVPEVLVTRADRAMYESKSAGRNRVQTWRIHHEDKTARN